MKGGPVVAEIVMRPHSGHRVRRLRPVSSVAIGAPPLYRSLCDALGLDVMLVRSICVDVGVNEAVQVRVEMLIPAEGMADVVETLRHVVLVPADDD